MIENMALEWDFSPSRYFEESTEANCYGYTLKIGEGKVKASIAATAFEADASLHTKLHECLNDTFLMQQLLTYELYELSLPTRIAVHPDGRRDYSIELKPQGLTIATGLIDFCVIDKNGNTIKDSKQERIANRKQGRDQLGAGACDELLRVLLQICQAAIKDPHNELVHLYEIPEALSKKFGNDAKAQEALGIRYARWKRLGQLCNNKFLIQGRHRGQAAGNLLRDASVKELTDARGIVREMICAYSHYVKKS
jgi:hypothetical protein